MNKTLEAWNMIQPNKTGRQKPSRGEFVLMACIFLIVAVFVTVVGILGYGMVRQRIYWNYVEEFSESTVYAYEHEGITVTEADNTYLLNGDAAYVPYRLLSVLPFGRNWEYAPEDTQSILFEFGDGSSLEVWTTPIENSSLGNTEGLCIRYCNQAGKIYQFDTEGVTYDELQRTLKKSME